MKKLLLLPTVAFALVAQAHAAPTLSYSQLVDRITNLESLAVLPLPGEKTALFSSYDRASRYDEATGKYVRWDANGDGGGIIRSEGEAQVLAEMNGPGCIWRIWSATPGDSHVRIYLDGAAEPTVDLPFKDYFSGKAAPFDYPALVYTTEANGFDNFVPIAYQKSCKIVADKGWGSYYQFTYSTFAPGTQVPTFHRDLSQADKAALAAANTALTGVGAAPMPHAGEKTARETFTCAPGETKTLRLKGPRAITDFQVKVDAAALTDSITTLRDVALKIRWDNEKTPSVAVPLGDFFGSAPGVNLFKSLPAGMTPEGFYSRWYMPFAQVAEVQFVNEGKTPVTLQTALTHAPLSRPIGELGRFHAKWHRDMFLPAEPERKIDWTLLKTQGRGRFCGVMLHVWKPVPGWWGEGDEKFFVDGEKFPSTIGTGSEDYFGYAWSSGKLFVQPLHGQTLAYKGQISDYRWHIADSVPFQQSFEGAIEKYFGPQTRYASTAFWYLAPGGVDPYELAPAAERDSYFEVPPTRKIASALEGETLRVLEKTGGNADEQAMDEFGENWSGNSQLWWTGAKIGDKLTLEVPVKDAGKYNVKAQLTKARDYGIVQLYLDGQKLGDKLDLFDDNVVATGQLSLGTFDLTAGAHKFMVEIVGANEKALKSYMVGLDYVKLEAVKP